jgi:UDP-N-acetylmuramate dehydrogenase
MTLIMAHLSAVARDLERICPGAVALNVPLARISRWRIGGLADVIVSPRSIEELARLRAWLHTQELAHVVIGATSNLLFADEGLRAIGIQIGGTFASLNIVGSEITAGPGVWVPGLARRAMQAGLTGIEHICGIPGTLGGLICMNGGSQRHGIGEVIVSVTSVDAQGAIRHRNREDCAFAYRHSVFQSNDEVIAGAVLRLEPAADRGAVRREMLEILGSRRRKFPQKEPNCGSVFVSDPQMYTDYGPPGAIIEKLGFKGRRSGGAEVSMIHCNFIQNIDSASAIDVLMLIHELKRAVYKETGYELRAEVRFVLPTGNIMPADQPLR